MKRVTIRAISTLLLVGLSWASAAVAIPPAPMQCYGTVLAGGENVPEGTVISALCSGEVVATTVAALNLGQSTYSLQIPGDDPDTPTVEGCLTDDLVSFTIALNGSPIEAAQTVLWVSGASSEVGLTAELPTSTKPQNPVAHSPWISQVSASPNPFNPRVTISFDLHSAMRVEVEVYDAAGRRLDTLPLGLSGPGSHKVEWGGRDATGARLASGEIGRAHV